MFIKKGDKVKVYGHNPQLGIIINEEPGIINDIGTGKHKGFLQVSVNGINQIVHRRQVKIMIKSWIMDRVLERLSKAVVEL
jgi:hypothetical protein